MRRLCVVLGDQLDLDSALFDDFDPAQDCLWMAEVSSEAQHVPSHKARIAIFLAAMRHFSVVLRQRGWPLEYLRLGEHPHETLSQALNASVSRLAAQQVCCVQPGEWRLCAALRAAAEQAGARWIDYPDRHFLCQPDEFADWARGRKQLRMEHFYHYMRKRYRILLDEQGQPVGGAWNFDARNRGSFARQGPGMLPAPCAFQPDAPTREVLQAVERHFPHHPGSLEAFDWPLTPAQAEQALEDFIEQRLPAFGQYQDAMWSGEPWLYHARLSAALNLKLIHPRRVIEAAVDALQSRQAPIEAVEGFVRQVLGWREFVRGVYWLRMPQFAEQNILAHGQPLPWLYWGGDTDMHCLSECVGQTMSYGYAHHIQRLMVLGNFALLLGVRPEAIHRWFLAVYVDAVEWVELPNVLGMSQYADGGHMVSKPYVASGAYVKRMSNYCQHCRFDPALAVGEKACPFTTLYWDFLDRHQQRFAQHPRTALQWRALSGKQAQLQAIREQAERWRRRLAEGAREPC
ncbi:cryptochrome/photolyase family protein [Pseudoxanthomonas sp. CAU 1598]|uniref:Cryptochrome/photolyase family protein n=1 Tax=Pseudomarimonas arenosa TaxID=2774145 RepID=A0AAW3ZJC2_9GAMM|nr:cryptochrome/photolyase family protein [Pseudomarimonas arenosa]